MLHTKQAVGRKSLSSNEKSLSLRMNSACNGNTIDHLTVVEEERIKIIKNNTGKVLFKEAVNIYFWVEQNESLLTLFKFNGI